MAFTIFIGLLFLVVVFFHYLQGFFSAAISAVLTVVAAVLAFSWHETIVEKLLAGKAANIADAMVLVTLFALIYLVLRIIFDKAIPEGVSLPAAIDRIGGALMGLVAAAFSTGIIAIAAQELPFGPSIAGYVKYDAADVDASLQNAGGTGQRQTGFNFNELHSDATGRFEEADRQKLFPMYPTGVDEIVVSAVAHLSTTGSLQGSQPLTDVHPDFLQELFGQRIGIQGGAIHVSMNVSGHPPTISVAGVFTPRRFAAEGSPPAEVRLWDGEIYGVRKTPVKAAVGPEQKQNPDGLPLKIVKSYDVVYAKIQSTEKLEKVQYVIPASDKQMLIVVRLTFGPDASDKKDMARISTGSIRLVRSRNGNPDVPEPRDYYPIGTLENGKPYPILYIDKPDDYLFVSESSADVTPAVDAVFCVDKEAMLTKDLKKLQDGVFIEVKRMIREDLSGKTVLPWDMPKSNLRLGVMHQLRAHEIVTGSTATYIPDPDKTGPAAPVDNRADEAIHRIHDEFVDFGKKAGGLSAEQNIKVAALEEEISNQLRDDPSKAENPKSQDEFLHKFRDILTKDQQPKFDAAVKAKAAAPH